MNITTRAIFAASLLASFSATARASEVDELKKVMNWAKPVVGSECKFLDFGTDENILRENHIHQIEYQYDHPSEDPPKKTTLYELYCSSGAYSWESVYVVINKNNEYDLLTFAEPKVKLDYTDDTNTKLKTSPKITGYKTIMTLTDSDFDPENNTITSRAKWRGLGDAWSAGRWVFEDNGYDIGFVLKEFTIDPLYNFNAPDADENIEMPESDMIEVFP